MILLDLTPTGQHLAVMELPLRGHSDGSRFYYSIIGNYAMMETQRLVNNLSLFMKDNLRLNHLIQALPASQYQTTAACRPSMAAHVRE